MAKKSMIKDIAEEMNEMETKKKVTKGDFEEHAIDVQSEVETLRRAAEALSEDISMAEERAQEMEALFATIREKRQRLRTINKVLFALTGEGKVRPRRPNGVNKSMITEFLEANPKSAVKVISDATGISVPSVRATLRSGGFAKDASHLWTTD